MKIIVGSTNPVKTRAVFEVFAHFFPHICVEGVATVSGVGNMPMSVQETKQGAINRAKACSGKNIDFSVGLEGGVDDTKEGMYLVGYACVMNRKGTYYCSTAEGFLLPESIANRIRNGEELGPIMDDMFDENDIKKKQGAIGIFSHGFLDRTQAMKHAVLMALIPFVNHKHYT